MIAPRSAGCASLISASRPSAAGVAPAPPQRAASKPRATGGGPPADADHDDRRAPELLEAPAPVAEPGEEDEQRNAEADAHLGWRKPAHQELAIEAPRRRAHQLEDRLGGP